MFKYQQLAIKKVRDSLKAIPIIYGSHKLDYIYRKHDKKPNSKSYAQVEFIKKGSDHYHACSEDTVIVTVDIFASNEIMTERLAYAFKDRFNRSKLADYVYMDKGQLIDDVVELTKNDYVQRVVFEIKN